MGGNPRPDWKPTNYGTISERHGGGGFADKDRKEL